MSKFSYKIGLY